jgi:hypothetical protein
LRDPRSLAQFIDRPESALGAADALASRVRAKPTALETRLILTRGLADIFRHGVSSASEAIVSRDGIAALLVGQGLTPVGKPRIELGALVGEVPCPAGG